MPPGVVPVPDAARDVATRSSADAELPVARPLGAAVDDDVELSRTTVLSRPRKSANSTRRISTATARIPSTPPGKVVDVVVVVPWVAEVFVSVPVTLVPPVGAGVCGEAVAAPASVPACGVVTLPPAAPVVVGVFVFWA